MVLRNAVSKNLTTFKVFSRCFSSKNEKNVAFIGLGNMGNHMAANLAKKGFKVTGYDSSAEALKLVSSMGVTAETSLASAVKNAAYVVTALPNNKIVTEVYLGNNGILSNVSKGAFLIDSSTVDPAVPREVAAKAKDQGLQFVDAPVSGGVMGAKNATLAFMVGGTAEEFARGKPLFEAMGARQFHCGPTGAGQVAKLCNNMLMAINMAGLSECLNLGIRSGLDAKQLLDILNCSTGRSWCSEVYCPVPGLNPNAPSSQDYKGGFSTDLLVKDLGLVSKIIADSDVPVPVGGLATHLYRLAQTLGYGKKDFSHIYRMISEKK